MFWMPLCVCICVGLKMSPNTFVKWSNHNLYTCFSKKSSVIAKGVHIQRNTNDIHCENSSLAGIFTLAVVHCNMCLFVYTFVCLQCAFLRSNRAVCVRAFESIKTGLFGLRAVSVGGSRRRRRLRCDINVCAQSYDFLLPASSFRCCCCWLRRRLCTGRLVVPKRKSFLMRQTFHTSGRTAHACMIYVQ